MFQGGVTRLAQVGFVFTTNSLTEQLTTFSRGFASLKVAIESHNTKGMHKCQGKRELTANTRRFLAILFGLHA